MPGCHKGEQQQADEGGGGEGGDKTQKTAGKKRPDIVQHFVHNPLNYAPIRHLKLLIILQINIDRLISSRFFPSNEQ